MYQLFLGMFYLSTNEVTFLNREILLKKSPFTTTIYFTPPWPTFNMRRGPKHTATLYAQVIVMHGNTTKLDPAVVAFGSSQCLWHWKITLNCHILDLSVGCSNLPRWSRKYGRVFYDVRLGAAIYRRNARTMHGPYYLRVHITLLSPTLLNSFFVLVDWLFSYFTVI